MTEQRDSSGSTFLQVMVGFFRFLIRFLFVLVVGVLIGLGVYYGVPWLYRRLVWPVQENSARIAVLEDRVRETEEAVFENHRELQMRLTELEIAVTELREESATRAQNQQALEEETQRLERRLTELASELETQEQSIEQAQANLVDTASEMDEEIEGVQQQLHQARTELSEEIGGTADRLDNLENSLNSLVGRLALLQTAQDLLEVRLLLTGENPGAARDVLNLAIRHLDRAIALLPGKTETLEGLRERMVTVDRLIADRSFRAYRSLQALWADLSDLALPLTAQSTVTPTQTTSPLATPTSSP